MLVYSAYITPRLQYITRFFSKELGTPEWQLTTDAQAFLTEQGARINYSTEILDTQCLHIIPQGLLSQTGIQQQPLNVTRLNGLPVFFQTGGALGFDMFAAAFYLLSRYEEYLPFEKDQYGRFPATASLAHKNGFLKTPLINYWARSLKEQLTLVFPGASFRETTFLFVPTYDIDMAWSYQYKGFWRNGLNFIKEAVGFQFSAFSKRFKVLTGKEKDPFDQFGWLNRLHEQYQLKPYYFFLVAEQTNRYDKNISPHNKAMKALVTDHAIRYPVGLHPSWRSNIAFGVLKKEKELLSAITGTVINASRQHFLKLAFPQTYRHLLKAGILFDFSMGYADDNGFRASVASPFCWYDLDAETATDLLIFPFCFMEGTSVFYKKEGPDAGLAELQKLYNEVKNVKGFFSIIWHNSSFTDEGVFKGWKQVYETFVAQQPV
ncbi:polysaccharide deacetylase family protein [Niabella sp. CC-SYL272]|uniref:polysaccharide deacetylase family protein n=1 Tax=Niabella agricola TaxID=2891571 RepID=UPI001F34FCBB|nr:polysaccharide deacetylase family protein [Niabella agricola]MCF3111225.1 polysaccharide deacetylase family protein [Niabella agricola]